VVISAELDAGTGMVCSVHNERVRFPEVDVVHEVVITSTEVVQFGGTAPTHEASGI
jgi:hypothetical protein